MRSLLLAGAGGVVALTLLGASSASAYDGPPKPVLKGTEPYIAGLPTVFSALSSNDGDLRGLTFQFDYESDGVFDASGPDAAAMHTYTEVGQVRVTLRLTDQYNRSAETFIDMDMRPTSNIGDPMLPTDGAPSTTSGKAIEVAVAGILSIVVAISGAHLLRGRSRAVRRSHAGADEPMPSEEPSAR